jgi:hypothetical protein
VLSTVERTWSAAAADGFLTAIGEDIPWYRMHPVAHPGWLIRAANSVLSRTVQLGPWIHVASRAAHHGLVGEGALLATRARVVAEYERRGHRFVELDVLTLADARPVLSVHHTAIYEPRQPRPT